MQINESQYLQTIDKLNSKGIQVIQEGDEIRFVLVASQFFHHRSPNLLSRQRATINMLRDFINKLPATTVQVAGYSDNIGSKERNYALSVARAKAVKHQLTKHELDTRLIYVAAGQELLPVTIGDDASPENLANRVEITLNPIEHLDIG